jgi:septal ring-binding cell division protein DamX
MVVTGVYESARSASQAIKALPQPWQRYNPWIRKIGGIQQNILAQLDG